MNKKDIVRKYIKNHTYFSLQQVIDETSLSKRIVKDYLHEFKISQNVFDAGYGFYSSVSNIFVFPKLSKVSKIIRFLKKNFPFADFIVWDTKVFQSFYHHTQTHRITFVEAEKDVAFAMHEALYTKYANVLKEKKTKAFFDDFDIVKDPIVVRNLVSRAPIDGYIPTVEKILIDMYLDMNRYNNIGLFDYMELWRALLHSYRISIAHIHNYSKRRKCWKALSSQLIEIQDSYAIDFCQLVKKSGKSR